jgi:hypothetical protein
MTAKLSSKDGNACYAKRKQTIEAEFGSAATVAIVRRMADLAVFAGHQSWLILDSGSP